jgi:hypothetical protein
MPEFHRDELVTFEVDGMTGKRVGQDDAVGDLAWQPWVPEGREILRVDERRIFSTTPGTANARDPGKRSRITLRPNQ